MSATASRTTQCLFCQVLPSTSRSAPRSATATATTRQFSSTTSKHAGTRRRAFPSIKAQDMGLIDKDVTRAATTLKSYTDREKQLLALKYTPAQLRAIEAAEQAIDPKDIITQGKRQTGPWALNYLDDMSRIHPVVDKPVRAPDADIDPDIRPRSQKEILERFAAWTENMARKQEAFEVKDQSTSEDELEVEMFQKAIEADIHPNDDLTPDERRRRLEEYAETFEGPDAIAEWDRFNSDANNFFYSPKGTLNSQSDSLAPAIPKLKQPDVTFEGDDEDPQLLRVIQQTGLDKEELRQIRTKTLVRHRVVNQTRLGKIQSQYSLCIAGDERGRLGIGEGKSDEPADSLRQARYAAIRNMKPIPRYENRTIYGEVEAKVGAAVVQLSSRPPGFGNRCQHLIYEMARAAGLQDLSARCPRSRNKMNIVKATYEALMSQRLPDDIARARGRKMVDVRKVYYSGQE